MSVSVSYFFNPELLPIEGQPRGFGSPGLNRAPSGQGIMQEDDPLQILAPFLPMLEQFARQYRMHIHYPSPDNLEEQARGAALCQLGFTTPASQLCLIRLDLSPRGWHLWVQRWGLHGLIAGRSWDLPPETGPEQLRAALERARDFASAPASE